MLLQTVHIPRIYTDLPPDPYSEHYCSLVLSILQGMEENCLLLVDDSELILKEITDGVDHWPPKYRKRAQEALTILRKRNRFVRVPFTLLTHAGCGRASCQCAISIASQYRVDCFLGFDNCTAEPADAVTISDFVPSAFEARRRESQRYELADGEWNKNDFELRIWEPIFRNAKHVKLFDRVLGHTVTERPLPAVKQNFALGLEWVFEQFVKNSIGRTGCTFEVTCALEGQRLTPQQIKDAADALRHFAHSQSIKYGALMSMRVKVETRNLKMRHARFIFTDQIALLVERGIDLLNQNGKVRDVAISIVLDPGKIESEMSRLPDAS